MNPLPIGTRRLGTMVAYGFPELTLESDLAIARAIGASVVEIFPNWRAWPDPTELRKQVADAGFWIHGAHGCWGGQTIRAQRVDLSDQDRSRRLQSVEDLKRCVDWLESAGGTCLVVHPGGISEKSEEQRRRDTLAEGLMALADHAVGSGVIVCVENMPPGVDPGSRMKDLRTLVAKLDRPELALALDTGHANLVTDVHTETLAAGRWLRTTHVHDNSGARDSHLIPGSGTIDWSSWVRALDSIHYRGPIMLECIRELRKLDLPIPTPVVEFLKRITAIGKPGTLDDHDD